jgi:hypothetical protein
MSVLDGLLGQLASNVDIGNLAAKVGLSPEQVEQAVQALGLAHPQPGDTVGLAAAQTGLPAEILQQIVGHIGGEGSLGRFASLLQEHGGEGLGDALGGVLGQGLGGALGGLFGKS